MIHRKKACFKTLTLKFRYVRTWILTSTSCNMPFSRGSSHLWWSMRKRRVIWRWRQCSSTKCTWILTSTSYRACVFPNVKFAWVTFSGIREFRSVFLANLEATCFKISFRASAPTMVGPPSSLFIAAILRSMEKNLRPPLLSFTWMIMLTFLRFSQSRDRIEMDNLWDRNRKRLYLPKYLPTFWEETFAFIMFFVILESFFKRK